MLPPKPFVISTIQHFHELSEVFISFHKNPVNLFLHFITTPLGFLGLFSIFRYFTKSSALTLFFFALYSISLIPILQIDEFVLTLLFFWGIIHVSRQINFNLPSAIGLLVLGYFLQDLSHLVTGEKTMQSSYSNGGHIEFSSQWLNAFVDHCYFLVPLLIRSIIPYLDLAGNFSSPLPQFLFTFNDHFLFLFPFLLLSLGSYSLDSKNNYCFFPGCPYFQRVGYCNLYDNQSTPEEVEKTRDDIHKVRGWTMEQNLPKEYTSHFWYKDLPTDVKNSFKSIAESSRITKLFREYFFSSYNIDILDGMNEIYVSGPSRSNETFNSDHVFYSRHVDGPFGIIPFVSVYRCIVGMDKNHVITTHFPLAQKNINAMEGDVLAFDFNREIHYITCDESKRDISDEYRVTLKLHYCVYPKVLYPLGKLMGFLNTNYNKLFRALFLLTILPSSSFQNVLALNVNLYTYFFDRIESLIGFRNFSYILLCFAVWYSTGSYTMFVILTSFIHYIRYIFTFYYRKDVDFGTFRRDVLVLKNMALAQTFYHYLFPQNTFIGFQNLDPISVLMIVIGYAISAQSTKVLGMDRTYFAAELGLVPPIWFNEFPYGYIPHPMIISQIFALLGFYKATHYREAWPWAVPLHILLYIIHMLQEHFDIYKKYDKEKKD